MWRVGTREYPDKRKALFAALILCSETRHSLGWKWNERWQAIDQGLAADDSWAHKVADELLTSAGAVIVLPNASRQT